MSTTNPADGRVVRTASDLKVYEVGTPVGTAVARTVLTLAGVVAMIGGAFLPWYALSGVRGVDVGWRALVEPSPDALATGFAQSLGTLMIGLALACLIGAASRSGAPTRLAGALGMAACVMYAVSTVRSGTDMSAVQALGHGVWTAFFGSLVATIGGFVATVRRVEAPADAVDALLDARERRRVLLKTDHEAHVVACEGGGWQAIGPGIDHSSDVLPTRSEAFERAREALLESGGGELVVHDRDGRVKQRETVAVGRR